MTTNFFSPVLSTIVIIQQNQKTTLHKFQPLTDVDDEDNRDNVDVSGDTGSSKHNKSSLRICYKSGFKHDFEWVFNEYEYGQ